MINGSDPYPKTDLSPEAELKFLCETLQIIQMPSVEERRSFFSVCEKHRPIDSVQRLRDAVLSWWKRRDALQHRIQELREAGRRDAKA